MEWVHLITRSSIMKKLLMTVAVLGCAAAVTAQTVTSANIVGYAKGTVLAAERDIYQS